MGANMPDAAGFPEDEKQEAFRIYYETRTTLESLVDDQIAHETEETPGMGPFPDLGNLLQRRGEGCMNVEEKRKFSGSKSGGRKFETPARMKQEEGR